MSATERLRAMLDERGIEHLDTDPQFDIPTVPHVTSWPKNTDKPAMYREWPNGTTRLGVSDATPEQAIAATLGPGTCEVEYVSDWMGWHCKSCDTLWMGMYDQKPSYCMRCGRKVASE